MTPEQIAEMNNLIRHLASALLSVENQMSNLVSYVIDLAAYDNIGTDDLKNAYTALANVSSYLRNGAPAQGNWRGNLNKVTKSPIV